MSNSKKIDTTVIDISFIKEYLEPEKLNTKTLNDTFHLEPKISDKGTILKYNKIFVNSDNVTKLGLFRSVVIINNNIVCMSPTKSLTQEKFFETTDIHNCNIEEFVEGTMINCFYNKEARSWDITTRSILGADTSSPIKNKPFNKMFEDVFSHLQLNWDMFNREYCYSFVLQHTDNKIVSLIKKSTLYLTDVFKIEDYKIYSVDFRTQECFGELLKRVNIPKRYDDNECSLESIKLKYCSMNTSFDVLGIMFKNGFYRCKIRNPVYEYLHNLKGNQPKLQYQYYSLRRNNQVFEFLKHYPEYKQYFNTLRKNLHNITVQLWNNYMSCFVEKGMKLKEFGPQFKQHMLALHNKYINELRLENKCVNRKEVINYINELDLPRLMYLVNYPIKQKNLKGLENKFNIYINTNKSSDTK